MIPNTDYGETITSGKMETGAASIELTPEMFTLLSSGMYTDKILAAIREPICNARDAQVDAEDGVPLEMHLPTRLEPFFHIRDFGEGLTERQIIGYTEMVDGFDPVTGDACRIEHYEPGLYLRYGKSTKRDSNLQIGGFGIGCKAPLAYSDSFIVESYQNGIVKTYTIYKEQGIPNVAKLNEKMTTEQNGLKVKIAVVNNDIDTFVRKAAEFLRFFNYPVDITGQSINTTVKYILQTDLYDTVECAWGDRGKIRASMGGVVYNVSDKYREELEQVTKEGMLILKFSIGDLAVAGSREALSEDEDTIEKLEKAVAKIKAEFYSVMKAEVADTRHTIHEAYQILKDYNLLTHDWRTGQYTLNKAAKDFRIGGDPAESVIMLYSCAKFRVINGKGGGSDISVGLDSFKEIPMILEVDRGSGYLKVARRMSSDTAGNARVILAEDDNDLSILRDYFGKSLTVDKVSVKYAEYFPKNTASSTTISIAASGLFTTSRAQVRVIDEKQEGYYIPFERNNCIMKDKPSHLTEFDGINRVVLALIVSGQLKQDEIFYSRKAGMRAIKKTKLVELTWGDVLVMAGKSYTQQDYKDHVVLDAKKHGNPAVNKHKSLHLLWEKVKANYPTWNNSGRVMLPTKGTEFLKNAGMTNHWESTFSADIAQQEVKYAAEAAQFDKDFPILLMFSSYWRLTESMVKDIISFCDWKATKSSPTQGIVTISKAA